MRKILILISCLLLISSCGEGSQNSSHLTFIQKIVMLEDADSPRSIAFADFDKDSRLDFALTNNGTNTVSIFLQSQSGEFILFRKLSAGTTPVEICAIDVNGDNKIDLLSTNMGSGDLSLFINEGDGTFGNAQTIKPSPNFSSYALACSDLDGDGTAEAVASSLYESLIYVFKFNPNNPTVPTYSKLQTGLAPVNIVLFDFDSSGTTDILILNRDSNSFSVYKNNGALSFILKATISTDSYPFGADATKIEEKFQYAVANAISNTIQIFQFDSKGEMFKAQTLPSGGLSTRSVIWLDIDFDNNMDLIAVNSISNNISILINNSSIFKEAKINIQEPSAVNPRLIVKKDINGDGVLDYAIVNSIGGIRLFISTFSK